MNEPWWTDLPELDEPQPDYLSELAARNDALFAQIHDRRRARHIFHPIKLGTKVLKCDPFTEPFPEREIESFQRMKTRPQIFLLHHIHHDHLGAGL